MNEGRSGAPLLPLVAACAAVVVPLAPGAEPFVAEFMASNQTGIADEDGSRSDWIEIHHPGPGSVSLEGWWLSDNPAVPAKWVFPAVSLQPGGTLLVWASGKDRRNPAAPLHTNFSLAKGGESVVLGRPGGTVADDRFAGYPPQFDDTSYGLSGAVETVVLLETNAAGSYRVPTAEIAGWRDPGFTPGGWSGGSQGFGYGGGFGAYYATDVRSAMYNKNGSIYIRLPFSASQVAGFTSLSLTTEHDDGFIAYLNGTRVDAVGAPASPAWNSLATEVYGGSVPPRSKTVNPPASLLLEGDNVVAVHGLNQSRTSSDFVARVRLTAARPGSGPQLAGYFATPTPNAPNGGASTLVLPQTVTFSVPAGTFAANFSLTLGGAEPGQTIRYTTDGSVPGASSPQATGPLPITASTTLRARVFSADGGQAGPVATAQYVKLAAYTQSFSSNLPLLVLDSRGQAMSDTIAKDVHLHVHDRDSGGTARLTGTPVLSTRTGFKIRGSSSAGYPKKPYGMELRDEQGFDTDHPLLGMGAESDWVLLAPYEFDRSYCHDAFVNELSRRMGQWAVRSRFVEVFFNQDNNDLDANDYIGVYLLAEKIKPGSDRLDIAPLTIADLQPPNVTGGYIFKVDRVDSGEFSWLTSRGIPNNTPGYARSQWFVLVSPEADDSLPAQRSWLQAEVQATEDALYTGNLAGFRDKADTASWIDHHILNVLAKNADAFRLSGFWHKDRLGKIKAGPLWDFDRSCESTDSRDDLVSGWHPTGDGTPYFDYDWWKQLFDNYPDARQWWVDRWQELRAPGGTLSTAQMNAVLGALQAEIGTAAPVRNTARWTAVPPRADYDGNGSVNHADEIYHMRDWLAQRAAWIDAQFVARPSFSRVSAVVPAGTTVNLTGPGGAAVYYTTDGSDPRASGGGVAAAARLASGPLTIATDVKLTARCHLPSWAGRLGTNAANTVPWSGPVAAVYLVDAAFASAANLGVGEIHFHPLEPAEDELNLSPYLAAGDFEFLELCNLSPQPVDLAGASFAAGEPAAELVLDHHLVAPGDRALVVRDRAAFVMRHGNAWDGKIAGVFAAGNLADNGERITLRARDGTTICSFAYGAGGAWPGRADGKGSSLEFTGESRAAADYEDPANWRSSSEIDGSPGIAGAGPDSRVAVNEVLSHTDTPQVDAIELKNLTSGPLDLSGWWLGDRGNPRTPDDLRLFRIPDGTVLPAGGYLVFDERDFNPNGPWNPAAGNALANEFALDGSRGDDVWLCEAEPLGGRLLRFADHVEFGAALAGVSLGRFPDGSGPFMPLAAQTLVDPAAAATPPAKLPGPNSNPRVGPVVIHEIHYQPAAPDDPAFEFVELRNTGNLAEPLAGWRLRGAADFDFGSADQLSPGAVMAIVGFDPADYAQAEAFRTRFGIPASVPLHGPWQAGGTLPDGGGLVRLWRADAPPPDDPSLVPRMTEDEANYLPGSPWPEAAGNGASLRRLLPAGWGNDPASWEAGAATPGEEMFRYPGWASFAIPVSGARAPGDDPDRDGIPNLLEYATGSDPWVPGSARPVVLSTREDGIAFEWHRCTDRADVSVTPQHGTDLLNWSDASGFDVVTGVQGYTEFHSTTLPFGEAARYFRLRAAASE